MPIVLDGSAGITGATVGTFDGNVTGNGIPTPHYPLVQGTAQTASGTFVDFTGIPSWARRVTISIFGVAVGSNMIVQLGTAGGFITTGYVSSSFTNVGSAGTTSTVGLLTDNFGSATRYGAATLLNVSGNSWALSSSMGQSGSAAGGGGGGLTLGAALDRIRITSVSASTFTAGQINILWE